MRLRETNETGKQDTELKTREPNPLGLLPSLILRAEIPHATSSAQPATQNHPQNLQTLLQYPELKPIPGLEEQ